VPAEDDRTLVDLMVDQIEFADVIVINKLDIALPAQVAHVRAVVGRLNPNAKVLTSTKSVVPVSEIIGTGRFDIEQAGGMASWQQDVADIKAGGVPLPETEEYDVGSFVFSACRPFHPGRLHALVVAHFFLCVEYDVEEEEDDESADFCALGTATADQESVSEGNGGGEGDGDVEEDQSDAEEEDEEEDEVTELISIADRREKQQAMRQHSETTFGGVLLRSKGFIWLASSRHFSCTWGQAGAFLSLSCLDKAWSSEVADDVTSPTDDVKKPLPVRKGTSAAAAAAAASKGVARASARAPYGRAEDKYTMHGLGAGFVLGDKRTELVLIGHHVDKDKLRRCLEECLLTDDEVARLGAPGSVPHPCFAKFCSSPLVEREGQVNRTIRHRLHAKVSTAQVKYRSQNEASVAR
jgi:G3E family GTPase